MKKYLYSILFVAVSFTHFNSVAEEPSSEASVTAQSENTVSIPEISRSNYLVGFRATSFNYEEPKFMSSKGLLTGIAASYFYRMDQAIFRLDGEYLQGKTDYTGGLQSSDGSITPLNSTDQFRVIDTSARWIFATDLSDSFLTSLFAGFGVRNTFDGKDSKYDYRRDITYYYLSFGPQFAILGEEKKAVDLVVEIETMVAGQAKTYLSDVSPALNDITNDFRGGNAYKLGLEGYLIIGNHRLVGEVSYKKWQVADSEPATSGRYRFIEPANTTALTTFTVGYVF